MRNMQIPLDLWTLTIIYKYRLKSGKASIENVSYGMSDRLHHVPRHKVTFFNMTGTD